MIEALRNKWKSETVTGERKSVKQDIPGFINSIAVLELLHYHVMRNSTIAIHCDVDLDGIGSGYILRKFLSHLMQKPQLCIINQGKEHGIKERHAEYFKNNPIDLFVVVDSSSNEINTIKDFTCDVIVIDHHEVDHNELIGLTNDKQHRFVILNNTLDNPLTDNINKWIRMMNPNTSVRFEDYHSTPEMSCGLVVYELLRLYQEAYQTGELLENLLLYQWVGVTLLTDAIPLLNERNQWYMDNTVHSQYVEPTLQLILRTLNKFSVTLDKSFISYTMAPTFNRAIRANANVDALTVVMNNPIGVEALKQYRELQDWSISKAMENLVENDTFCKIDLTNTGINKNYTGVIAGKACDDFNKNAISYTVEGGVASGSFRGRNQKADYRAQFNKFAEKGVSAQGHHGAFGFTSPEDLLDEVMSSLTDIEGEISSRYYLTAGNIPEYLRGEYHIDDIDAFRKQGGLMMLGIGNSKVASDEQILITTSASEAKLTEVRGKLFIYDIFGIACKAFKEIDTPIINIYAEYSKTLELYIK